MPLPEKLTMTQAPITCLTAPAGLSLQRPALVVAHPGHELHAFGWVSALRPVCFVLTDGARRGGAARLSATASFLDACGARRGSWFGSLSDDAVYRAILDHDATVFCALADRLADTLIADEIDHLVSDAVEYFNPAHDICCYIADAAAMIASRRARREIPVFRLLLAEDTLGRSDEKPALQFRLGEELFAAKLKTAASYRALEEEVAVALDHLGTEYFREERFYLPPAGKTAHAPAQKPYYERFGESRVVSGQFQTVIRHADHVRAIENALRTYGMAEK